MIRRYARKRPIIPGAVAALEAKCDRGSKYGNRKTNGYHSARESKRARELKLLEKAANISGLLEQVRFELIPAQYADGKCLERSCVYIADFVYLDHKTGQHVVEDSKGFKDNVYRLKRKLMLKVHGVRIRET